MARHWLGGRRLWVSLLACPSDPRPGVLAVLRGLPTSFPTSIALLYVCTCIYSCPCVDVAREMTTHDGACEFSRE
jgi:hypothetical protein